MSVDFQPSCPLPSSATDSIQLAHGGGGSRMQRLLDEVFLARFRNPLLDQAHDGAVFHPVGPEGPRLAFTTDAFVVQPLFFPGGDIGSLAIHGTVNDLAMCGARARWLSAAFILEEGCPIDIVRRVADSMAAAAKACGVEIVTGDTKVVDRGRGDGLHLAMSGIGNVETTRSISPREVREGDVILVSGDLGRHGAAILSVREGLSFETTLESDSAALVDPALALIEAGLDIHCLRDLTRGGLSAALHEVAAVSGLGMQLDESRVPVGEPVRAACELFGLDPLYVANEGRFAIWLPEGQAARALEVLRRFPIASGAEVVGRATPRGVAPVLMRSAIGTTRIVTLLTGEQLPRIC